MIELKNITKVYKSREGEHFALKDVSLHVNRGEVCGIIGGSGAGKSTLVRCINLLERPTSGEVLIDGVNVTQYEGAKLRRLRAQIGMIFQSFSLFQQRTVLDNVMFPLLLEGGGGKKAGARDSIERREDCEHEQKGDVRGGSKRCDDKNLTKAQARKRAQELLELVELSDKAQQYPAQLSGGQQQRVAIARALANNPRIMLCDEATSALDTRTTVSVLNLLKKINEELGVTLVIITHSLSVARYVCDHVAVLDAGQIVEEGDVSEVLAHPKSDAARELVSFENLGSS